MSYKIIYVKYIVIFIFYYSFVDRFLRGPRKIIASNPTFCFQKFINLYFIVQ